MTKVSLHKFKTAATNFFWPMTYICLIVSKVLADMYDFQINFCSANNMSILLKVKKNILKMMSTLVLANKKIF